MSSQPSRPTTVQTALGLIFILSTLLFLILYPAATRIMSSGAEQPFPQPGPVEIGTLLATITSLITAAAALIGLISTAILGWRRDAREARQAALQQQLTELQIEKERAALNPTQKP
jgi:hypothetical protein